MANVKRQKTDKSPLHSIDSGYVKHAMATLSKQEREKKTAREPELVQEKEKVQDMDAFYPKRQNLYFHSIDPVLRNSMRRQDNRSSQEGLNENMGFNDGFDEDMDFILLDDTCIHLKSSGFEQEEWEISQPDVVNELVIGCRLANGVVIKAKGRSILLRGIEDMPGKAERHFHHTVGLTRIARSLWEDFLKNHPHWPLLENGTVFVSRNRETGWDV